jgi:hypothetical protein
VLSDLTAASGPPEGPELWVRLLVFIEARGPLLIPRVADEVPMLRRAVVLDTLVVLADANLVQLRTARGVAVRPGWRARVARPDPPEGIDAAQWAELGRLLPPPAEPPAV